MSLIEDNSDMLQEVFCPILQTSHYLQVPHNSCHTKDRDSYSMFPESPVSILLYFDTGFLHLDAGYSGTLRLPT